MKYSIRAGTPNDLPEIEILLPRLADFDVPTYRVAKHLWQGDRDMVREWALGNRDDIEVVIAVAMDSIVGVAVLSLGNELLSGEPSVHLEVLAVGAGAEGAGVGSALIRETETIALAKGAKSISLHVFSNNKRARTLYERQGFNDDLRRYYKSLGDAGDLAAKFDVIVEKGVK